MQAQLASLGICVLMAVATGSAQNVDAAAQSPAPVSESQPRAMESRRILKIFPAYGVVQNPAAPFQPLTSQDKFVLFVHGAADPSNLLVAATNAGIEQAADIFPGYGQGAEGYGKRFGASLADQASNSLFKNFAFPVLLREDPRYFRKGQGTIIQRFGYAISRVLVTRRDSGSTGFNFSRVLGSLASSALANTYYPASDQGTGSTFARVGIAFGTDSALNVISEFGSDLSHKFLKGRHSKP